MNMNWNLEDKQIHKIRVIWVNICRFILAAVFIFSGFVKANDPWGTVYKIQDYMEAWGIAHMFPDVTPFLAALVMGVLEFTLGFYLLVGIRRRLVATLLLLMMAFMTPLTLWLAVANPISDCGCFGDAVILTNWETFWKNIGLLIAAISVFKWRKTLLLKWVTDKVDWLMALYGVIFIIFFSIYSIRELPVFDFRPYHIGADIRKGMEIPEGEKPTVYETTFIYRKDGVEKEFTIDNFPSDTTWTFVDSRTRVKEKGYEPPIHDFAIMSVDDGSDLTDEILDTDNYTFLLVSPQLSKADESGMDLINEVYDYSVEHGYRFLCVTSSPDEDIVKWQDRTGAEYPFGLMDEITLKTMIRSNPGLMLLKKGVILNKWSVNRIPDEYQLSDSLDKLPLGTINHHSTAYKLMAVTGWFFGPLLFLLLCDLLWLRWKKIRQARNTNQSQQAEKKNDLI